MDQVNSSLARVRFGNEDIIVKDATEKLVDSRPVQTSDDRDQETIEETRNTALEGTLAHISMVHGLLIMRSI